MNLDEIKTIGVIGAGTMGHGIAQVCALSGYQVVLVDVDQGLLDQAVANITASVDKLHAKNRITDEQFAAAQTNITPSLALSDVSDAQIVIEAATENKAIKLDIFKQLDTLTAPETILATNTSSIPITEIGAVTNRPAQVIGMHFMNPVPIMKLIEVIRGLVTSQATTDTVIALAEQLGKTPVEAADFPGFIANRILIPMINEAIFALMEGVGTAEAIDTVLKLGANHPMGPLALADLIGLDVVLSIMEVLYAGFGDPKYRACPLLRQMVAAGHLGRKSGQGFYSY
ncbi:MAG: 3-hydroxybutyryl-CoA dehydrogenase [Anaerolineae bacterium]|nr:3-hydroxybutyryl-CoA dehydrogenase [Anaerolineae bacterium]